LLYKPFVKHLMLDIFPSLTDNTLETQIIQSACSSQSAAPETRHTVMINCLWGSAVWMFQTGSWIL